MGFELTTFALIAWIVVHPTSIRSQTRRSPLSVLNFTKTEGKHCRYTCDIMQITEQKEGNIVDTHL